MSFPIQRLLGTDRSAMIVIIKLAITPITLSSVIAEIEEPLLPSRVLLVQEAIVSNSDDGFTPEVRVGDIDGDRRPDLAFGRIVNVGGLDTHSLHWIPSLGAGKFGESRSINQTALDGWTEQIELSDIDGDDLLDVAVVSNSDRSLSVTWYENLGLGTFSEMQTVMQRVPRAEVILADLDNDDALDYLLLSETSVEWSRNDGKGNFGAPISLSLPIEESEGFDVDLKDLNGNGRPDLLISSDKGLTIHWNGENVSFTESTLLDPRRVRYYVSAVGDIDGDGDVDIAMGNDDLRIYWNDNDQYTPQHFENRFDDGDVCHVGFIDLENDGFLEVFWSGDNGDGHNVWPNKGGIEFPNANLWINRGGREFPIATPLPDEVSDNDGDLLVADLDGDGYQDLISVGHNFNWSKNTSASWLTQPCGDEDGDGISNILDEGGLLQTQPTITSQGIGGLRSVVRIPREYFQVGFCFQPEESYDLVSWHPSDVQVTLKPFDALFVGFEYIWKAPRLKPTFFSVPVVTV